VRIRRAAGLAWDEATVSTPRSDPNACVRLPDKLYPPGVFAVCQAFVRHLENLSYVSMSSWKITLLQFAVELRESLMQPARDAALNRA
jgi:hypothetical protein